MLDRRLLVLALLVVGGVVEEASAAAPTWNDAVAVLERACWDCHGKSAPEAELDLSSFTGEADVFRDHRRWEKIRQVVENGEMPPRSADSPASDPLSTDDRKRLLTWIDGALDRVAAAHAGDPGRVTLRRLTNREYDNTIRDLTGLDLRPARGFVKDNGGGEGFTNTGDTLFVSPEQLEKYLQAAREIASRASVLPGSGIEFREEPVGLRSPASVAVELNARVRTWYYDRLGPLLPEGRNDMRADEYLLACWRHRHKQGELRDLAKQAGLEFAFLENWWKFLEKETKNPFLNRIRIPWQQLPGPEQEAEAKRRTQAIAAELQAWLVELRTENKAERKTPDDAFYVCVGDMGDGTRGDVVEWTKLEVFLGSDRKKPLPLFDYVANRIAELERRIAGGKSATGEKHGEQIRRELVDLRAVLALRGTGVGGKPGPADGFTVRPPAIVKMALPAEVGLLRGSTKLDPADPDAKLASVQTMIHAGAAPELPPLFPGVRYQCLDKSEVWADFSRAIKAYHAVFPGSRAGRMEEVGSNLRMSRQPIGVYFLTWQQLADRLPPHERETPQQIYHDLRFFYMMSQNILRSEHAEQWDDFVVGHLARFAARAYRRPLTEAQTSQLREHYLAAFEQTENREEAAREVITRVLFSAPFLFKTEPPTGADPVTPLDAWELASRLSYFLWASIPDAELAAAAADGSLLEPAVLERQVRRMLADPKSAALAGEFFGQWLGFGDFRNFNGIDRKLFPAFDDELREAMHAEVSRFFAELVKADAPITDLLDGDYTFVNRRLAEHYGLSDFTPPAAADELVRIEVAEPRGGILGMSAILAATAFPDRASPVRRGNWIVKTVLGFDTPPAPADVPELKNDGLVGKLSLRDRLEKHRASEACRGCHSRIDPPGFALNNFDALGRWADNDAEGRPIDARAALADGREFVGPAGLKQYLGEMRGPFLRQFSKKLLGYALGREVVLSDRALLKKMEHDLASADYRLSAAVLDVVLSRQFLNRRNHDLVSAEHSGSAPIPATPKPSVSP